MRLYSFTNMYTAGIHAGIQTAHLVHEMMRKYEKSANKAIILNEEGIADGTHKQIAKYNALTAWADQHKTIIVKCGGYHSDLVELYGKLKEYSAYFDMPVGRWRESKEALNHAQTAVGIVLPSYIYNFKEPVDYQQRWPRQPFDEPTEKAYELWSLINKYRMAT